MNESANCKDKDLLRSRSAMWLFWVGPSVLVVGTGSLGLGSVGTGSTSNIIHTVAWTFAFTVGGAGCLVNARRCGRLHCFYTGPLYLLAALASLLYGLGFLPLGRQGWNVILGSAALGTVVAIYGLERLFDKYRGGGEPSRRPTD